MTEKKYRLVISVFVAIAMITTTIPMAIIAVPPPSDSQEAIFEPTPPTPGYQGPNAQIVFEETFDADLGAFTATDDSGDGAWAWDGTEEAAMWADGGQTDDEDDTLSADIALPQIDTTCNALTLQFDYWGEGGVFEVLADTDLLGTFTATALATADIDLTAYQGTTITLTFHVDATETRTIFIDNVVIAQNPTTDIIINGIEGMEDGGRYNTFPKWIDVNVTNGGTEPITGADFHLQIYKEVPFEPIVYKCWDMETCFLLTWDVFSWDGDQASWYWTEKRSYSPTHSYHSQPDYLDTYEADSFDSLVLHDYFAIPTTIEVDGHTQPVTGAYLTFWHWCEGEFDGTNPIDYGVVSIETAVPPPPSAIVGGPYYDTNGEWVQETIDISAWIGESIKINFTWISDEYLNFEGWYIDDVCIELQVGSDQPLIFQGYSYEDFEAGETRTFSFPIQWTIEEPGTYYIQVYTDYEDCNPLGNEINWTIWFGDVCDGEITDIVVPPSVQMPNTYCDGVAHEEMNWVIVPIDVTVHNNGTLVEDIPVEVTARHKITENLWKDDVESGDLGYTYVVWGGDNLWNIVDADFYSPFHSWHFGDTATHYPAGVNAGFMIVPEGEVDWADLKNYADADIVIKAKWDFRGTDMAVPVLIDGTTWYFFIGRSVHLTGNSGGWQEVRFSNLLAGYVSYLGLNNIFELPEAYGFTNFRGFALGICGPGLAPTVGGGAGLYIDDILVYKSYAGEVVWSDTLVAEDLEPCHSEVLHFEWNTTEYCDYIITATVKLDCDMDPTNDEMGAPTRIWKQIYEPDTWEKWEQEDNTYGLPDHWHIVEECSICPDDHKWWNGDEATGIYPNEVDEVLVINRTFDFTGLTEAYISFETYYYIEAGYDYGYVEVSNDCGDTWFRLATYTGNTGGAWVTETLDLIPGTTILYSEYTDFSFVMPIDFFTDKMHFRFRFVSDELSAEKGWFIDDVVVGSGADIFFFDDMEDATFSADAWYHMATYARCHWHEEDEFGVPYPGPDDVAFWNGEPRNVIGSGTLYRFGNYPPIGTAISFGAWTYTKLSPDHGSWNYWYGVWGERTYWAQGYAGEWQEMYRNYTVDFSAVPLGATITFYLDAIAYDSTTSYWLEVSGDSTSQIFEIPGDDSGNLVLFTFDLSAFAGMSDVLLAFHVNHTTTSGQEEFTLWDGWIDAEAPIWPYGKYYNNVDEKLIFYFDLTHAYEAFLEWDQNYSFADSYPDDYGLVEIWTGSEWKTLFIVQGNSGGGWGHMKLDISDYVGGSELTKIRFRFISNDANVDYGWLIDNISIQGKIDYKNPTASATLSPATPNGCNGWYKTGVTVTLTATDNVKVAKIYYRIDGGTWKVYTAPFTVDVDGSHTIDYYAEDEVGNTSPVGTVSFKIDKTAPTVTITAPQAGYIYLMGRQLFKNPLGGTVIIGGINFEATASDAMSGIDYVTFNINGYSYDDASAPYKIWWHKFDLMPTKYTLTVSAYDEACNKAADQTLSFTHWL
ncbi:MAG: immune inhibitor A [Thermoplasmatales archaeon]|nr:immune inhibitor A [Thermoplasmatales archaeon]